MDRVTVECRFYFTGTARRNIVIRVVFSWRPKRKHHRDCVLPVWTLILIHRLEIPTSYMFKLKLKMECQTFRRIFLD